jgi:hypothetical protein
MERAKNLLSLINSSTHFTICQLNNQTLDQVWKTKFNLRVIEVDAIITKHSQAKIQIKELI